MYFQRKNPSIVLRSLFALSVAIAIAIAVATAYAQSPGAADAQSTQAAASPDTSAGSSPAAGVNASAQPTAAANPASTESSVAASAPDAHTVISYLTDVINWYGHLSTEAQLVRDPDETLYFADDRQTAGEVLRLAFDYARAQAAFLAKANTNTSAGSPAASASQASPTGGVHDIARTTATVQASADKLQAHIRDLQAQLAKAPARQRDAIASQSQAAQNELEIAQARLDALTALSQFETSRGSPDQNGTLMGQIDELENSSGVNKKTIAPAQETALPVASAPAGILGLISNLFALDAKLDSLDENRALAQALAARATAVRKSIIGVINGLDASGTALAQGAGGADVASLKSRKKTFELLLEKHKLASAAALPLSKQIVLLGIYNNNVARWQAALQIRRAKDLRSLLYRLIALSVSLLLIFIGSTVWRWLTDRYVTDIRRRGQVMAARRLVLTVLVVIVLMINFSQEIGSAATIVGFAAAGIAVALQNVILSIAGYFFLIGRFGIKAGDRVQIGGVTGDVIYIGLVKLSLMELGGTANHLEPTGRVVVFSNAIVFQPSGNFFKQAPGTSFVWNELRLTLAPDVDYRLAEKRLLDAVDEVFARYRDRVMRDYRHLERDLNIMLETPKPQSRLHLSQNGLEIVIRYPAETYSAPQINDEISRRLLDAINRESSLRLVEPGNANIQAVVVQPAAADNIDQTADANGQSAEEREKEERAPAAEKPSAAARASNK
jgi:small-conductance mechanosensitive channel